jgi:hypothetical protein
MNDTLDIQNKISVVKPSQFLNIGYVIIAIVTFFIGEPILIVLSMFLLGWKVLELHCVSWVLTHDSIIETRGVFNVIINEVHYFRIKYHKLYQPLLYRFVGLSRLTLITSDKSKSTIFMYGIYDGKRRMQTFKNLAVATRKEMGVKEFDIR